MFPALEHDDAVAEVVEPCLPTFLEDEEHVRLARLHEVLLQGVDQFRRVDPVPFGEGVDAVDEDQRLPREVPLHRVVRHVDLREVAPEVEHDAPLGDLALAVLPVRLVALLVAQLDPALELLELRPLEAPRPRLRRLPLPPHPEFEGDVRTRLRVDLRLVDRPRELLARELRRRLLHSLPEPGELVVQGLVGHARAHVEARVDSAELLR